MRLTKGIQIPMKWLRSFWRNESGQGLAEYTLLLSVITLALVVVVAPFREALIGVFTRVAEGLASI